MDTFHLVKDINAETDVKIGTIKTLSNGGKMAYVSYKDRSLAIQIPEMYAPFGMNTYVNEDTGIQKHSIELSFRNIDDRESLQKFKKFIEDIDSKVIETAFQNSQAWFKKKYSSKEVLEALYTSSVKYPKDKETGEIITKYPPTFKVNLPEREGSFRFEAYNKNQESVNLKEITTKGSKFICIIQCGGVWIAGGKFGVTWKAVQLQVTPPQTISGFSIKNVKSDNIDDDNEEDISEVTQKLDSTEVDDSDEDDDEDDDSDDEDI